MTDGMGATNSIHNEPRASARAATRTRTVVPALLAFLAIIGGCSQQDSEPVLEQPQRFPEARSNLVMERLNEAAETLARRCLLSDVLRSDDLKVAVGAIKGPHKPVLTEYGNLLGDEFVIALGHLSGKRIVQVSRKRLLDVLNAQAVEQSALFDAETVKSIDRAVGADVVVVGELTQVGDGLKAFIEMVDLETKKIVAKASADIPGSPGQEELFLPAGEREPLEVDFDVFAIVGGLVIPVEDRKSRLPSKTPVKLRFYSDEPCHLYVWWIGPDATVQPVIPSAGQPACRLGPHVPMLIPAEAGVWLELDVGNVGTETICIYASRKSRTDLHDLLTKMPLPPARTPMGSGPGRKLRQILAGAGQRGLGGTTVLSSPAAVEIEAPGSGEMLTPLAPGRVLRASYDHVDVIKERLSFYHIE